MADTQGFARSLIEARRDPSRRIAPGELPRPRDALEAYAIQHEVAAATGPIGGWKVGAPGPEAQPSCAPMPASGILASPARLDPALYADRLIESEIAFRLGRDLKPRPAPYTRSEILAAIASCHPGIEVLQTRFADPEAVDPLSALADSILHGAYVVGPAIPGWTGLDFAALTVRQIVDGAVQREGVGNPAGDMIRLVAWLADEGARWAGGLKAGQIVTCGSWTGKAPVAPVALVVTRFEGAPEAELRFG